MHSARRRARAHAHTHTDTPTDAHAGTSARTNAYMHTHTHSQRHMKAGVRGSWIISGVRGASAEEVPSHTAALRRALQPRPHASHKLTNHERSLPPPASLSPHLPPSSLPRARVLSLSASLSVLPHSLSLWHLAPRASRYSSSSQARSIPNAPPAQAVGGVPGTQLHTGLAPSYTPA